jgi:hypothetical protein
MSFTGRGNKCLWCVGLHFPSVVSRNCFAFSRSVIFFRGAVIHSAPVFIRLLCPLLLSLVQGGETLDASLFMTTPRNCALSALALVMSVFSRDSSSFRFAKKEWIWSFLEGFVPSSWVLRRQLVSRQHIRHILFWNILDLGWFGVIWVYPCRVF